MSIKEVLGLKAIYVTSTPTAHLEFSTKEDLTSAATKLEPLFKKGILAQLQSKLKGKSEDPVLGVAAMRVGIEEEFQNEIIKSIPQLLEILGETLVGHKKLDKTVNVHHCKSDAFNF